MLLSLVILVTRQPGQLVNPTTKRPNSQATEQPDNQATEQPSNRTARQPSSQAAASSYSRARTSGRSDGQVGAKARTQPDTRLTGQNKDGHGQGREVCDCRGPSGCDDRTHPEIRESRHVLRAQEEAVAVGPPKGSSHCCVSLARQSGELQQQPRPCRKKSLVEATDCCPPAAGASVTAAVVTLTPAC